MKIKYMYFNNNSIFAVKTPVCTSRTRVLTCIYIKIMLFGTLTGTADVAQVVLSKN